MALNTKSIDLERSSTQSLSITDGSQTGLDFSTAITLMGWIKLESNSIEQNIVAKYKFTGSNDRSYSFYINSSNFLRFGVSDDGTAAAGHFQEYTASTTAFSTATWYHVAVTFDVATETCIFYVNGSPETSSKTSGTTLGASIYNGAADFFIGARDTGASNAFDGKIDEFGAYNAVLSSGTISSDYNSGNGTTRSSSESSIVAGWRFEDDLLDVTSNNNDLTNNNSAVFSTDVPFAGSADTGGFMTLNAGYWGA